MDKKEALYSVDYALRIKLISSVVLNLFNFIETDYSRTLTKDHLDQETTLLLRPLFTSPV